MKVRSLIISREKQIIQIYYKYILQITCLELMVTCEKNTETGHLSYKIATFMYSLAYPLCKTVMYSRNRLYTLTAIILY